MAAAPISKIEVLANAVPTVPRTGLAAPLPAFCPPTRAGRTHFAALANAAPSLLTVLEVPMSPHDGPQRLAGTWRLQGPSGFGI